MYTRIEILIVNTIIILCNTPVDDFLKIFFFYTFCYFIHEPFKSFIRGYLRDYFERNTTNHYNDYSICEI